jgi:hypothetical protein
VASTEVDGNLVAFLGTAVGASVFTIGLVSHRLHTALTSAATLTRSEDAYDVVGNARGPDVLLANVFLLVAVVGSAVAELCYAAVTWTDWVTLVGFCLVEISVVGLGYLDDRRVCAVAARRFAKAS